MNNKRINIGINILRMWMALEVILLHRCDWSDYNGFFFRFLKSCQLFSVPVFMIVSFYLAEKVFSSRDDERFFKRLVRIIIPQIGWALICWLVYVSTDIIFMHELSHSFKDLIIAIISGCRQNTNPSTWFQMVLLILTIIYYCLFKICKDDKVWYAVIGSFFIALGIQATGFWYDLFENSPYELNNTIGRIFEIMPYAALGLYLSHDNAKEKLLKNRYGAMISLIVLFIIGFFIKFTSFKGFFAGIYPIYMATWIFMFFLILPLDNIDIRTYEFIRNISRFTLGIYCGHRLVFGILDIIYDILHLSIPSFSKCLLTYIACYIMSYIMSKIKLGKLVE